MLCATGTAAGLSNLVAFPVSYTAASEREEAKIYKAGLSLPSHSIWSELHPTAELLSAVSAQGTGLRQQHALGVWCQSHVHHVPCERLAMLLLMLVYTYSWRACFTGL